MSVLPVKIHNNCCLKTLPFFERTCFIGHTHRPGVITENDGKWHAIEDLDYTWKIDERKTMINIGSVGQPRDGDPRACYVIYDGKEVLWRRVSYDIDKVRDQIYANPELIDRLPIVSIPAISGSK